jgi:hypothetical protein
MQSYHILNSSRICLGPTEKITLEFLLSIIFHNLLVYLSCPLTLHTLHIVNALLLYHNPSPPVPVASSNYRTSPMANLSPMFRPCHPSQRCGEYNFASLLIKNESILAINVYFDQQEIMPKTEMQLNIVWSKSLGPVSKSRQVPKVVGSNTLPYSRNSSAVIFELHDSCDSGS